MPFKFNISEKGKSWKLEADSEELLGRKIGEKVRGEEISSNLEGYELEITGTSDKAGFPGHKEIETEGLRRILLTKGKFMRTSHPKGLRLKKTVRGNTISKDTIQINLKVIKSGSRKLDEIFPEQNKPKEKPTEQPAEVPATPAA